MGVVRTPCTMIPPGEEYTAKTKDSLHFSKSQTAPVVLWLCRRTHSTGAASSSTLFVRDTRPQTTVFREAEKDFRSAGTSCIVG